MLPKLLFTLSLSLCLFSCGPKAAQLEPEAAPGLSEEGSEIPVMLETSASVDVDPLVGGFLLDEVYRLEGASEADEASLVDPKGFSSPVRVLERSPDGQWLAAADQTDLLVWRLGDLEAGPIRLGHSGCGVRSLAFSDDSSMVAAICGDASLWAWQLPEGALLWSHPIPQGAVVSKALDFDEEGALYLGAEDVALWRLMPGDTKPALLIEHPHANELTAVLVIPEGVVTGGYEEETLKLWDQRGVLLKTLQDDHDVVQDLAFDSSTKLLAVGGMTGLIKVYDLRDLQAIALVERFEPENAEEVGLFDLSVRSVAWGPDAKWLASLHQDGALRFWTLESGQINRIDVGARAMALGQLGSTIWLNEGEQLVQYQIQQVETPFPPSEGESSSH